MKKKRILIVIGIIICVCIVLIVIIINKSKLHQSENVYAKGQSRVFDDNGMYYFKNGYLMFMDNTTGISVPLCAKANCSHNSTDCDACYLNSHAQDILLYDDMVYVSYFTTEYYTDSNGKLQDAGVAGIECCKKDGSGRKQIYQSDTGAVLSMLAVDGRLYYTAWKTQPGTENMVNYYMDDSYLYCYDMDWGITRELLEYQGDSEHYSGGLELAESTDKTQLYVLYSYKTLIDDENGDDENGEYLTEWLTLDMKGNVIEKEILPVNICLTRMQIKDDGIYVKYTDDLFQYDLTTKISIWKEDGTEKQLFEITDDGYISNINNYYYYIYDENQKLIMDYEENKFYIAKSAVSDFHIVPDIYLIDKENDVIYYDTTDYTGVADGATFSEDPTNLSCMKWSEFLEEYFVEYEGQEIEGLTIGD